MVNNLKSISKFTALSLLATTIFSMQIVASTAALARGTAGQDAAFDKGGSFVRDTWGKCVRTKWDGNNDPCAPAAPPPPPAPVAQPAPPPPPPAPVKEEPKVELDQRTVYFAFDSAKLDGTANDKLNALAKLINDSKQIGDVSVVGYTDQMGTDGYNVALAQKRVHAVKEYLDARSRLDTKAADIRAVGKAPAQGCMASKDDEVISAKGKKGKKLSKKAKAKAAKAAKAKAHSKVREQRIDCMKDQRRVEIELKYVK